MKPVAVIGNPMVVLNKFATIIEYYIFFYNVIDKAKLYRPATKLK